jgi:hypothetical protein
MSISSQAGAAASRNVALGDEEPFKSDAWMGDKVGSVGALEMHRCRETRFPSRPMHPPRETGDYKDKLLVCQISTGYTRKHDTDTNPAKWGNRGYGRGRRFTESSK